MTTRSRDRVPYPATASESTDPQSASRRAIDPPARPGARHDSDPDGLSTPSSLSRRIRSDSEPIDVMLRKIASETPRVPNSFEPSVSRQVVHAPVRAVAGHVEAGAKVAVDPSPLEHPLQGTLQPSGANDLRPGGDRQALTVHVRRETPFNRGLSLWGILGLGLITVATGTALLWSSRVSNPSLRTGSSRIGGPAPSGIALPSASAPEPPPIEVSASSASAVAPRATPRSRGPNPKESPTQPSPSIGSTRATRPRPVPPSPSAAPPEPFRPAATASAPPVPSDIDKFIHPMTP